MFYRSLNIEQRFASSCHHQSNGWVEACIRLIKHTLKKCLDTKSDSHIALLQMISTSLGPGLPSPAMLLFNHPIRGIMSVINRPPIGLNNDDDHCDALIKGQTKIGQNHDTSRTYTSIPIGSIVVVQHEDGGTIRQ